MLDLALPQYAKALAVSLAIVAAPFILLGIQGIRGKKALKELRLLPLPGALGTLAEALKLFGLVFIILVLQGLILNALGLLDTEKVAQIIQRQELIVLLMAVTIGPLGEELLFRGYLQKRIGIIPQAVLFSALHYGYGSISQLTATFLVALAFGLRYRQTQNIYSLAIAHALYNLFSISAVLAYGMG